MADYSVSQETFLLHVTTKSDFLKVLRMHDLFCRRRPQFERVRDAGQLLRHGVHRGGAHGAGHGHRRTRLLLHQEDQEDGKHLQ